MPQEGGEPNEPLPLKLTVTALAGDGARLSQVGTAVGLPAEELMVKSLVLLPQNIAYPPALTAMTCTRAWVETAVDGMDQEPEVAEPGA